MESSAHAAGGHPICAATARLKWRRLTSSPHIENFNDKQIANILLILAWGRIKDSPVLKFNDQPVAYFQDVETVTRLETSIRM